MLMTQRTLLRAQLALASLAVLLAGVGGWWSWRAGDRHGLTVALSLIVITSVSSILTRVATRSHRDHSA
jgi:hypothetical protein